MTYELITLWSYRTGCIESGDAVRTGLAFDLTHVDLTGKLFVRAALQLPARTSEPIGAIRLSDPAGEVIYGKSNRRPGRAAVDEIVLSIEAIADLQQAAGAFFTLDAACEDVAGDPQSLSPEVARRIRLIAVAAVADSLVAA